MAQTADPWEYDIAADAAEFEDAAGHKIGSGIVYLVIGMAPGGGVYRGSEVFGDPDLAFERIALLGTRCPPDLKDWARVTAPEHAPPSPVFN